MSIRAVVLAAAAVVPAYALAAGGHDTVGCVGCHGILVKPNKVALNPRTNQPFTGTTALCLACHEETSRGGQGYAPISSHVSHPYGLAKVNANVAKVPPELLREGGRFECMSCHDPHPSNPRYKYLRVETRKGSNMDAFCGVCHPAKADPGKRVSLSAATDPASGAAPEPAAPAASQRQKESGADAKKPKR